ncbi:MAG: sulfatase-like hydrolase/transferase [Negativicutes bacterium]|nr:sulfatase-like hydrolase/transferase [Negativicutes bacterium]
MLKQTVITYIVLKPSPRVGDFKGVISLSQVYAAKFRSRKPNFLILMTDENRYPPIYEGREIKQWRKQFLRTQEILRRNGVTFQRHYTASTACCPSRATIFTGQYPSLHGVSQTTGAAKGPFDPEMFWLDPNSVPTLGDYFRTAGYRTFYKGKWHISDADILIPGTHKSYPSYNTTTGFPLQEKELLYLNSSRLETFGFSGWIGPEPHGPDPHKSGSSARIGVSGRDEFYAADVANLLEILAAEKASRYDDEYRPWFIVASFVNPHDIVLYGSLSEKIPQFKFKVDDTVPAVPPPPTFYESLETKPQCQLSSRLTYGAAFQPLIESTFYRQLYYQLQKNVDQEMLRVFNTLRDSSFYENTIVIFTSDHGELLGAHGGLTQKWYCAYEEAIHVPLIIHNPVLFEKADSTELLTSHIDLLPTLLGLAGINIEQVQDALRSDHTEVRPLVGRDLSPLVLGQGKPDRADEPLYFMTDDDITKGLDQHNFLGWHYHSVFQPNHIETVIAKISTPDGDELWKYSRYFDNPQFWTNPGIEDTVPYEFGSPLTVWGGLKSAICATTVKNVPLPDQYEMYNLSKDPLEIYNLAHYDDNNPHVLMVQQRLAALLLKQRRQKRLSPSQYKNNQQP